MGLLYNLNDNYYKPKKRSKSYYVTIHKISLGFPPGREGTGFPGTGPVPSGNRDGTEWSISRPVVPTGKGREGTGNAKKCQDMKNYFKGNN